MKRDYYRELLNYISEFEATCYDETAQSYKKQGPKVRKMKIKALGDCRDVLKKHFAKEMFKDTRMTKYEFESLDGDLRNLCSKRKDKHYKGEVNTIRHLITCHYSEEAKKIVYMEH